MITFDQTSSGHKRWSCCCGRAAIRQPYMSNYQWADALLAFINKHDSCEEEIIRDACTLLL